MNKADTCRTLVRPKLEAAGRDDKKHFLSEQTPFTDGRLILPDGKPRRLKKNISDFLLRYTRNITLAVVEAKSDRRPAVTGFSRPRNTLGSWATSSRFRKFPNLANMKKTEITFGTARMLRLLRRV